jgi:transposase
MRFTWVFKRNNRIHTEIGLPIAPEKASGLYDVLGNFGYQKRFHSDLGCDEFVQQKSHIDGIKSFWSYAKIGLSRFRGINKTAFY